MALSSGNVKIIIIAVVFSVLAAFAVFLRFYTRIARRTGIQVDDYTILCGLVFTIGYGITNIVSAVYGNLGGHIPLNSKGVPQFDSGLTIFLQAEWASQLIPILALSFTKASILLFYRRIFRGKTFQLINWGLVALVVMWAIAFFFATLFECVPIDQVWNSLYGTPEHVEHCYEYLPMFYATAISDLIIDIFILATPIPMIWQLQMATRQKIALSGVFFLGAFVVGITAARIYFFYQAGAGFDHAYDITYNIAPTMYWSQLQCDFAVISACLPTLRPLFHGFSPKSVLRSFANKFSLPSVRSKGSVPSFFKSGKESSSSNASLKASTLDGRQAGTTNTIEAVYLSDLEASADIPPKQGAIFVQTGVHQSRR